MGLHKVHFHEPLMTDSLLGPRAAYIQHYFSQCFHTRSNLATPTFQPSLPSPPCDILDLIENLAASSSDDDFNRIVTRLIHCSCRINRLQPTNDNKTAQKLDLLSELLGLESDLSEKQFVINTPASSTPIKVSLPVYPLNISQVLEKEFQFLSGELKKFLDENR
ncbi:hypothetical protein WA026_020832 [Henosepilachna vigintioctopunctata]|uniref:Uncharacterized protein n=1 Tax=Henosepilachna vigintioctopunctata TaxID=420089 RepID=A0AAW1TWL0_9CUCU